MNSAPKLKSKKSTRSAAVSAASSNGVSPLGKRGGTPLELAGGDACATSDAELKSIKQKLIAQGVKYCIGAYVDIHGVPKGKFVPIDHFEHFAHGSELYTGYALDGLGAPNALRVGDTTWIAGLMLEL